MNKEIIGQQVQQVWWGDYQLELGQTARWCVGPFLMAVTRGRNEWRIQTKEASDEHSVPSGWEVCLQSEMLDQGAYLERHLFDLTTPALLIRPSLADRSVVTRPESPLHLHRGEEVRLYISTPLWITARVSESSDALLDTPLQPPSDTWFGSSTWEGELCYATHTRARLNLVQIPTVPQRALTTVWIRNSGSKGLLLDRLLLPVRFLTLFADKHGNLWTNDLRIEVAEQALEAELYIEDNSSNADATRLVAASRDPQEHSTLTRAIKALLD